MLGVKSMDLVDNSRARERQSLKRMYNTQASNERTKNMRITNGFISNQTLNKENMVTNNMKIGCRSKATVNKQIGLAKGDDDQVEGEEDEDSETEQEEDNSSDDEEMSSNSDDTNDDDDDDDDNDNDDSDDDPLIYKNASIKLSESMISIFMYAIEHNLTENGFANLLSLISLHLPADSRHKKTVYKFMKYFDNGEVPLVKHFYCSECLGKLISKDSICDKCSKGISAPSQVRYFIELPIINQLQTLLLQPEFINELSYKYNRVKDHHNNIEDIYDGILYKEYTRRHNPKLDFFNFTFMWYIDISPMFKSSKSNVYPFYLVINELPYEKRILKENMILAGLWFGTSAPRINLYLHHLYSQLKTLYNGVNFRVPNSHNLQIVKVAILCGTCNAVSRAQALNHVPFNEDFGCPRCYSKGYTVTEQGKDTHIYPFEGGLKYRNCDDESYNNSLESVVKNGRPCFGVKGPSVFKNIMPNMVRGISIDVIDNVYLGVTKYLVNLLFDSAYQYKPWSLYNLVSIVDQRLKKIKPPSFIKKRPKSLSKHSHYWKAQEWKHFLLFYSLPILKDLMNEKYFHHYSELVLGIRLLNQKSISLDDLNLSRRLLISFVAKFQTLYDPHLATFNIHCLLHLQEVVQDLGPLWVTCCLPFKDFGKIKDNVNGTHHIDLQTYLQLSYQSITTSKLRIMNSDSEVFKYCDKIKKMEKQADPSSFHQIAHHTYLLGKLHPLDIIPQDFELILRNVGVNFNHNNLKIHKFLRLKIKNGTIYSKCYKKNTLSNSYCVKITSEGGPKIGYIEFFLKVCYCTTANCELNCKNSKFYAFFKEIICQKPFKLRSALHVIESGMSNYVNYITNAIVPNSWQLEGVNPLGTLISISSIVNLCCMINIDKTIYIVEPENDVEYGE